VVGVGETLHRDELTRLPLREPLVVVAVERRVVTARTDADTVVAAVETDEVADPVVAV
jgi:hypothetical protein